jgi:beta-N-acetylhexosaminidase
MLAIKRPKPLIVAIEGTEVTSKEEQVLRHLSPVGFILFKRNCQNEAQLKALCQKLKTLSPMREPLIFIDQEGGRVNRISWEDYMAPAGRTIGDLYEEDHEKGLLASRLNGYVLAAQLYEYGINVNCLPVADVATGGMHDVICDRAFSSNPETVAALCASTIAGLMAGGVYPIIKHAPGHGRAKSDSHLELPKINVDIKVLKQQDFYPFIVNKKCPLVMTAHILYPELDSKNCATHSKIIINDVLKNDIGLSGIIVSDDINMQALEGSMMQRATKALNAGCDLLLHCSGKLDELNQLTDVNEIPKNALEKLEDLPNLGIPNNVLLADAKNQLKELLKV